MNSAPFLVTKNGIFCCTENLFDEFVFTLLCKIIQKEQIKIKIKIRCTIEPPPNVSNTPYY